MAQVGFPFGLPTTVERVIADISQRDDDLFEKLLLINRRLMAFRLGNASSKERLSRELLKPIKSFYQSLGVMVLCSRLNAPWLNLFLQIQIMKQYKQHRIAKIFLRSVCKNLWEGFGWVKGSMNFRILTTIYGIPSLAKFLDFVSLPP